MLFNKTNPRKSESIKLDVHEAYTLWRALIDRYSTTDHMNLLRNFIHDNDFIAYISKYLQDIAGEIKLLENLMQKFSIAGPEPATLRWNRTVGNSEAVKDQDIATVLYRYARLDVNLLALSLKFTPTNDAIWSTMIDLTRATIYRIDRLIKYFKLKNWLYEPPLYPYIQPNNPGKIATNEIALLWDHLIFRYHNLRQTQIYSTLASDPDLAALLKMGVKILQKDIKALEDKMIYFGIVLPKHYTHITSKPEDKTPVEDKFILNIILYGMRNTISLHTSFIHEIIVNDDLRKFFIDLTFDEINYLDKFTKYGKLKGWVYPTPIYKGAK